MRLLPTGASSSGMDRDIPRTVVSRSQDGVATAHRGRKVRASKARQFSRKVVSRPAPPSM